MHPPDRVAGANPPSPPRLNCTDLPDVDNQVTQPEPFLSGHPILLEDMDIADLTQAQLYELNQRLIEESMESDRPLISSPEPTSNLRAEYLDSHAVLAQINTLISQGYTNMIRVRGDGNCFYRALAFTYLYRVIKLSKEHRKQDWLAATKNMLAKAGFDPCVYDYPYEILQSLIQPHHTNAEPQLWMNFRDTAISNYIVIYMRLLTSAQMRLDDRYAAFLFDPESQVQKQTSVEEFCAQFVEPLAKEADHIQVAALTQALGVQVRLACLDGRITNGQVNFVDFPEEAPGSAESLVLLYRPGHYDILQRSLRND